MNNDDDQKRVSWNFTYIQIPRQPLNSFWAREVWILASKKTYFEQNTSKTGRVGQVTRPLQLSTIVLLKWRFVGHHERKHQYWAIAFPLSEGVQEGCGGWLEFNASVEFYNSYHSSDRKWDYGIVSIALQFTRRLCLSNRSYHCIAELNDSGV